MIRWEMQFKVRLFLFSITLFLGAPLLASLLEAESLRQWIAGLDGLMENHRFREVTGFVSLAFVAFQFLLMLRKRTRLPIPRSSEWWQVIHRLNGSGVLLVNVIHTGGQWGVNLNGWLLSTLVTLLILAQGGHVMKAYLHERAKREGDSPPPFIDWLDTLANTDEGALHKTGLQLHLLLVAAFVALLAFHILSVYYY